MSKPLVKLKKASFGYDGKPVVKDIDFEIKEGDFFIIIGPNGSGKTTLAKAILGILKPLAGEAEFRGKKNGGPPPAGYVPQKETLDTIFPYTVYEIIESAVKSTLTFSFRKKDPIILKALTYVGMEGKRNSIFSTLSGGEKQRVLIARALALDTSLLVLDEPTTGLDEKAVSKIMDVIKTLKTKGEQGIVMITHEMEHIKDLDAKILRMEQGRLI